MDLNQISPEELRARARRCRKMAEAEGLPGRAPILEALAGGYERQAEERERSLRARH